MFLQPPADCDQLFLTAAFSDSSAAYNGHLLIDNLSPIVAVDCEDPTGSIKASMDFAPPASGAVDLTAAITHELEGIRWSRNGFSLQQQFFPDPKGEGELVTGNQSIFRISQYLKAHPEALLTVVVGPRKDPLVQHHIRLLAAEFMAAGLPPKSCLIRPMKKRDLKKGDWLNELEEEVGVLWGLSYQ